MLFLKPSLDQSISVDGDYSEWNTYSTLRAVFTESQEDNGFPRPWNVLDMPNHSAVGKEDVYDQLPHDMFFIVLEMWKRAQGSFMILNRRRIPLEHLYWSLAATSNASHGCHCDAHGLGTFVANRCGKKLWAIHYRREGDTTSFFLVELDKEYDMYTSNKDKWDTDAIVLLPQNTLYVPSISRGASLTDQQTC